MRVCPPSFYSFYFNFCGFGGFGGSQNKTFFFAKVQSVSSA